ncbi:MAG TPA: tetratricopeptide repeat protein [Puia sp.]|jgi:tetratricopeptide (TPR) repeat protein|nr:tetratricopeptide repeat protein [Puia sp.]
MKRLFIFSAGGTFSFVGFLLFSAIFFSAIFPWADAAAQSGDTPGGARAVTLQLSAKSNLYDRVTVLNYLQNQEFDEAIAYLAPILQADSGNTGLLGYAGYAYYMSDEPHAAAACYERLLRVDSNNIPALHYLLLIDMNDRPVEAMAYGRRLLQLDYNRAVWWRIMGELCARNNQRDSAMICYDQAYALAPGDIRTIAGLADLLLGEKAFDRVDSMLAIAAVRDSMNVTVQKLQVRSAYLSQRFSRALVPGERLVRSGEPAIQALTWLALSYYDLKQYPDCIRVCEHMLDLGLVQEAIYYYDARAQAKLRQYKVSDSLLTIARGMAISPTAEWYFDDLGNNHESLKEYAAAVANYDSSYYLFRDPLLLYSCGRICETELHDLARARRYYLRYMAMARPKTEEEKKALQYVRRRWGVKGSKP